MMKYTVGAIQLNTSDNKDENLKELIILIEEAVEKNASLVALPENMNYIGVGMEKENAEDVDGYTIRTLAEVAIKHNIWIHCGSIYEKNKTGKPYNTTFFLNPNGEVVSKYRKLHMFDVDIKDGPSTKESDSKAAGNEIVTVDTELGKFGFSICYDIRFPEIYRMMALNGAQIFFTPANFTLHTGKDHWETILRTRAIENACYVIAPGQIGIKPNFQSYGKSLIIDPWGNVIAKASDKPCVITAEIDLEYQEKIRRQVPSLKNRRSDVYTLSIKK